MLTELDSNMFFVAVRLRDSVTRMPVGQVPNEVRFFARVVEGDGKWYVNRGDFEVGPSFDSVIEARQYIQMLFELER